MLMRNRDFDSDPWEDEEYEVWELTFSEKVEMALYILCGCGFWVIVCVAIWMFFGESGDE